MFLIKCQIATKLLMSFYFNQRFNAFYTLITTIGFFSKYFTVS